MEGDDDRPLVAAVILTVLNSDLVNDWEPPLSEMKISRQTSRLGDLVKLEVAWSCKESERAIRNYASGSKVAWKRLEETEIFHFGVGTLVPDSIILILVRTSLKR